ncbi:unnamed protein product [Phytophthora fragariaefolia]|uniref:Unnamed protein product n=1 Tax=Phytophthora fragariaefolia TaxID=1490495 RepID=A0A9W6U634_9STRA|nr:unnamed protein product [Phytophthora fragariaefolia]
MVLTRAQARAQAAARSQAAAQEIDGDMEIDDDDNDDGEVHDATDDGKIGAAGADRNAAIFVAGKAPTTSLQALGPSVQDHVAALAQQFLLESQVLAREHAALQYQQEGQKLTQNAALMAVQASTETNVWQITDQQRDSAVRLGCNGVRGTVTSVHCSCRRKLNNKTKCRVWGKVNSVYVWDGGGGHPSSCESLKCRSIPDWLKWVWLPTFIQFGNDNGAHASRVPVPTFVHCVPILKNTTSSTSESGAGSAGPSAYHVMEKDLKPWELYDLSSTEEPENLDAMKEYFMHYQQIRGKMTNNAYTRDALQRS